MRWMKPEMHACRFSQALFILTDLILRYNYLKGFSLSLSLRARMCVLLCRTEKMILPFNTEYAKLQCSE